MNRVRTGVAAGYLGLCLLLGGASAAGAVANGLLQLVAVILILVHVWIRGAPPLAADGRWLAAIFAAFALVAAAQLIPLPASLWADLPGREAELRGFSMIGAAPGALPASLDPTRTWASLLWLLPPAAMFLLTTRLTRDERSVAAKVVLGIALASIALGAVQLFGGDASPWRFYQVTNINRSVGFFANANHVATLLLCSLPFAALFIGRASKSRSKDTPREGRAVLYGAIAIFIAIGIAINGSLAAYGLLLPAVIGSIFLYRRATGKKAGVATWAAMGAAALLFAGLATFGPLNDQRIASKFDANQSSFGRKVSIPTTIEAGRAHFPLGSGLGTFRDVYRTYEPAEEVTSVFVNHAHNDYAEFFLELGLAGVLLIAAFLWWWASRAVAAWRGDYHGAALARAGSIAIGIILLHSLVDYPLRTSAMAAIAAFCAGLMVQPPAARSRSRGPRRGQTTRHLTADEA